MAGSTTGPLHLGLFGYYDEHRHWHPATALVPEEHRVLPETVPHEWLAGHRVDCACAPCSRFPDRRQLARLKRAQLRESASPRG